MSSNLSIVISRLSPCVFSCVSSHYCPDLYRLKLELGTSILQLRTSNFELRTLNFELRTLNFELRTPKSLRGSPVEHLELHRDLIVVFVPLRHEGQVKAADRERPVARSPKNGIERFPAVGHPEPGMLFFGSHALNRPGMGEVAQHQVHGRVADAGLLQLFQLLHPL